MDDIALPESFSFFHQRLSVSDYATVRQRTSVFQVDASKYGAESADPKSWTRDVRGPVDPVYLRPSREQGPIWRPSSDTGRRLSQRTRFSTGGPKTSTTIRCRTNMGYLTSDTVVDLTAGVDVQRSGLIIFKTYTSRSKIYRHCQAMPRSGSPGYHELVWLWLIIRSTRPKSLQFPRGTFSSFGAGTNCIRIQIRMRDPISIECVYLGI